MSIGNLIKGALLSLKAHKLRVFLTMIGIIIGISSVVVILSIGAGLQKEVAQSSDDVDANKMNVYFEPQNINTSPSFLKPFSQQDLIEISRIEGVEKVEPSQGSFGMGNTLISEVSYFDKKTTLFVNEYDNDDLKIDYGRGFAKEDSSQNLMILTNESASKLFDSPKDAIGQGLNINGVMFEIIGVLEKTPDISEGISFDMTSDLIQKESFKRLNSDDEYFDSIDVSVKAGSNLEEVFKDIKKELELLHPDLEGTYNRMDPQEITKVFQKIIGSITMFITFVSGISLFVGGIGVMNIMYVSVSERRREIGIRRAIGAKPNSILLQFLFESIFVTFLGGLIGILCGFIFSKIAGAFLPFEPVITLSSFVGASSTSIIVGIVFGIIPAYKASNLDPIKAIYK